MLRLVGGTPHGASEDAFEQFSRSIRGPVKAHKCFSESVALQARGVNAATSAIRDHDEALQLSTAPPHHTLTTNRTGTFIFPDICLEPMVDVSRSTANPSLVPH